jgi:hypothetical protein
MAGQGRATWVAENQQVSTGSVFGLRLGFFSGALVGMLIGLGEGVAHAVCMRMKVGLTSIVEDAGRRKGG